MSKWVVYYCFQAPLVGRIMVDIDYPIWFGAMVVSMFPMMNGKPVGTRNGVSEPHRRNSDVVFTSK